jgi:hypothetical protein
VRPGQRRKGGKDGEAAAESGANVRLSQSEVKRKKIWVRPSRRTSPIGRHAGGRRNKGEGNKGNEHKGIIL